MLHRVARRPSDVGEQQSLVVVVVHQLNGRLQTGIGLACRDCCLDCLFFAHLPFQQGQKHLVHFAGRLPVCLFSVLADQMP
ncbi:hypothetical protein D3C72_1909260 [compost metagenome]